MARLVAVAGEQELLGVGWVLLNLALFPRRKTDFPYVWHSWMDKL
jgi:hypothetical protein